MRAGISGRFCRFSLFCALLLVPGMAAWSAGDPTREALESRYQAMKAATAAHDGRAIAALLAPNFVSIDVSGQTRTASQIIQEVTRSAPDPNKSSTTMLMSINVSGSVATVRQRYDMHTVRVSDDGAKHSIEVVALSSDVWVKNADSWLIEQTVTNELSYFVDGKLVTHKVKASASAK